MDCASLPETLIENELFGHERGAFTGADMPSLGRFDQARGGTIFLDELGEMPLAVQGKLLRVLQDRAFDRVGGTTAVTTDARIVAATNRNLELLVEEGRFRGDLYYRVKVVELVLPPLRSRGGDDILRLAHHFVRTSARRHGRYPLRLSPALQEKLTAYPWPGNVRELEHTIESAVVTSEDSVLRVDDVVLPERPLRLNALHDGRPREPEFSTPSPDVSARVPWANEAPRGDSSIVVEPDTDEPPLEPLAEVERRHILAVLQRVGGHRSRAALVLGIGRNTLTRKLKQYGL